MDVHQIHKTITIVHQTHGLLISLMHYVGKFSSFKSYLHDLSVTELLSDAHVPERSLKHALTNCILLHHFCNYSHLDSEFFVGAIMTICSYMTKRSFTQQFTRAFIPVYKNTLFLDQCHVCI